MSNHMVSTNGGEHNDIPQTLIMVEANEDYTWNADGIYSFGVSNYEILYCCDVETGYNDGIYYKRLNLEDSSYYDEEDAAHIRSIITNSYPYVSIEEMKDNLYQEGFEYAYAYKREDEKIGFQCADGIGVVEVKAKETDDGCDYVIYWYVDRIGKDNKVVKRIQVWDEAQTYFYTQEDDGQIHLDSSQEHNPRPHVIYKKDGDENTYFEGFGFIPFFRLDNCRKQFSDLKPIKELIDDYDMMSCGLSNNIQDTAEALYVVKGFQGDNLDELMTNIRAKKHIGVDENGGVEVHTVDIPIDARKAKLELDEKNIYRFGMGFNSAQIGDGNITNIVIKSRYALLDLKCNKLEIRLKQFMRKLLKVVLNEINEDHETDYQQKDVYFDFEREVMTNAADNAQIALTEAQTRQAEINTLLGLATYIDDETLLQLVCEQLDIDYDDIKSKQPNETPVLDPAAAQNALINAPTEPDVMLNA